MKNTHNLDEKIREIFLAYIISSNIFDIPVNEYLKPYIKATKSLIEEEVKKYIVKLVQERDRRILDTIIKENLYKIDNNIQWWMNVSELQELLLQTQINFEGELRN